MGRYVIRRVFLLVPTMFFVSLVVFASVRLLPGDVVDAQLAQAAAAGGVTRQSDIQEMRNELGLSKPAVEQYFRWLGGVLRGNLGKSLVFRDSVWSELRTAVPVSLELAVISIIISVVIAIPLGALAALYQDSFLDYAARILSVGGLSIPDFVVGTVVIVMASTWFGWIPRQGYVPFFDHPLENLTQFIIPAAILGLRFSSTTLRMVRSSMLEVLRADYVRTAQAKGLTQKAVIVRHALKNAMIPSMTLIGGQIGFLIGGTFIIETIFTLPGVGRLTLEAINNRDYTELQGSVLFLSFVLVMVNLVTDLSYGWLDPRIRYS